MNYTNQKEESTNYAKVSGIVVSEPKLSHTIEGENFYEFFVEVGRLSQQTDVIPITISERTLMDEKIAVGSAVEVVGQYRSYNKIENEKSRLILNLFAREIRQTGNPIFCNEIKLTGFICKEPIYRKTPKEREICDILLAVNRQNFRKSDYIPCILWGRNARFVANQPVGTKIELTGRIQSRKYSKTLEDGTSEEHTAYEVSCQSVMIVGSAQNTNGAQSGEVRLNEQDAQDMENGQNGQGLLGAQRVKGTRVTFLTEGRQSEQSEQGAQEGQNLQGRQHSKFGREKGMNSL